MVKLQKNFYTVNRPSKIGKDLVLRYGQIRGENGAKML